MQVLHYFLDLECSPEEAVAAPRLHWRKNTLNLEPNWPDGPFAENPHEIIQWKSDMFFGGVHTVGLFKGALTGAGDPRRSGVVDILQ